MRPQDPRLVAAGTRFVERATAAAEQLHPRRHSDALHFTARAGWIDGYRGTPRDELVTFVNPDLRAAYRAGIKAGTDAREADLRAGDLFGFALSMSIASASATLHARRS